MAGKAVSVTELAQLTGVHRDTISAWLRKGCPYLEKADKRNGKNWLLDVRAVMEWREKEAVRNALGDTNVADAEELKRRKLAAETSIAEIAAAREKEAVAEIETFEKVWQTACLEFSARLRQLPSRVATQVAALKDEAQIKEVLLDEIDQTLVALSENESTEPEE